MHVHLLGNPQFFLGIKPLPLPTPDRAFALCAYLLLHRWQPLNRDHVAFVLWPDVAEDEARANLRRPEARWRPVAPRVLVALLFVLVALALAAAVPHLRRGGQPVLTSVSGAETVVDTWLNYNYPTLAHDPDYGLEPYASYAQDHLQYFGYPYDRMLLRLDLTSLPRGAAIQRALLTLHLEPFLNEDLSEALPATVSAYRLRSHWSPDSATFIFPWAQPGLLPGTDYDALALDSQEVGDEWVTLDVTEPARDWLVHPGDNAGLVIMISAAPYGAHYWVDTTDHPLPDRRPRLDITYLP